MTSLSCLAKPKNAALSRYIIGDAEDADKKIKSSPFPTLGLERRAGAELNIVG
jgi:hypothetical protein